MNDKTTLHKPIFIVGHARAGSTLLASIIFKHSQIGPKSVNDIVYSHEEIKDVKKHLLFSEKLEQKNIWFKYFKGKDCFTHMGIEILEKELELNQTQIESLIMDLTKDFKQDRFLSKAPTNTFRLIPILKMFPDSKIIVLLRRGEEVVSSWGNRHYGFGKRVNWGNFKVKRLSYVKGINIFVRKWLEVIKVIEELKDSENLLILTYDDLINKTSNTLNKIIDFSELPYEDYLSKVDLNKPENIKKKHIPFIYRIYLYFKVMNGNKRILKLKS
jgi:hypothetical protein